MYNYTMFLSGNLDITTYSVTQEYCYQQSKSSHFVKFVIYRVRESAFDMFYNFVTSSMYGQSFFKVDFVQLQTPSKTNILIF